MSDEIPRRVWAPRHTGFPVRLDNRGRTALVDDADYVRGLIEQVLFTAPGERINRPDFGSGVGRLVFAPSDDALAQSTQALVHGALQRWLGDLLRVENVTVVSVDSRLEVVVEYLLTASAPQDRRTVTVAGGVG